jgi:RHS repeat-associated protein
LTEFLYSGEQFDSKIEQQYLRQRYYDAATGRFNRLDSFFGNQNDPQSLHKYLYTHADPVNAIDPTGRFGMALGIGGFMPVAGVYTTRTNYDTAVIGAGTTATTTLMFSVLNYTMKMALLVGGIGTGVFIMSYPILYSGDAHPNDVPTSVYTARLNYLLEVNRLSAHIGDIYDQYGLERIKQLYPHWGIIGSFSEEQALSKFPKKEWNKLSWSMNWANSLFNCIGYGGVYVSKGVVLGGDSVNIPTHQGITLSHNSFWNNDPYYSLEMFNHEGLHSVYPFLGHNHIKDLYTTINSATPAFQNFTSFLEFVKDNNGTGRSLKSYILEEAARHAPPPQSPPPIFQP